MKLVKTTFTNERFFSRYAYLAKILSIVALIGQFVSGTTESIIIYSTSLLNFEKMLAPEQAHVLAIIVTVLGVGIIELGLIALLPLSIQAFLYKRFKHLDLLISIFIIPATCFLLCIGTIMSFQGSKQLVQKGFGEVTPTSTLEAETKWTDKIKEQENKLDKLISQMTEKKTTEINQLSNINDSKQNELAQMISQYRSKEKRTGKSYITTIERLQRKSAQELDAFQQSKMKVINKYDERENDLRAKYESTISGLQAKLNTEVQSIENSNKKKMLAHESNISNYGSLLGYLNIVMVFILVCSNIIKEAHHKGSGIESKVLVSDSYFQENVFISFLKSLIRLADTKLRELVNWIESKTPDTPQPVRPQTLVNRKELNQVSISVEPRNRIGFNRHEKTTKPKETGLRPGDQRSPSKTTKKSGEIQAGDFEYRNTLRDLTKYKKRLASQKQKAMYQEKTKGFINKRTSDAIENNKSHIDRLQQKLIMLRQKSIIQENQF